MLTLPLLAASGLPALAQVPLPRQFPASLPDLEIPIPGGYGGIATNGDLGVDGDLVIVASALKLWA